jgi:hypothetical protein
MTPNLDRSLSEIFEIDPVSDNSSEIIDIAPANGNENSVVETDSSNARVNVYDLLKHGKEALEFALQLAKDTENPKVLETVPSILRELANLNNQLLEVQKQKQILTKSNDKPNSPTSVTNNAIFVGSTKDLNDFLSKRLKNGAS